MIWTTTRSVFVATALVAMAQPVAASQDRNADTAPFSAPRVEKPEDQGLTCDQLHAEATALEAEVMAMTKEVETIAMRQQSGMMARQKAGSLARQALSGLASTLIPGAGGLIGMGIGATSGPAMGGGDRAAGMMKALQPIIERQTFASERMRHVGMLYAEKCAKG